LIWDGADVSWTYDGADGWYRLDAAQFPHFSDDFDRKCPEEARGYAPPFIGALIEPGLVQIWSGLIARTAPDWSLLVRSPANVPRARAFELLEGIVETDNWFGPLFTNIRLSRTDTPIRFRTDFPLMQVQPVPRDAYGEQALGDFGFVASLDDMTASDWEQYCNTIVRHARMGGRERGRYAKQVRRRMKSEHTGECPFREIAGGGSKSNGVASRDLGSP
jgi:hypothetical protein